MENLQKRKKQESDQETSVESISEESVLSFKEPEDELLRLKRELQEELLQEAERNIPDLEDDEEVFNGFMAQILTKLNQEEPDNYFPPENIEMKMEEVLNEDLEDCALLIDMMSKCIKKQMEYKQMIDKKTKRLSNIVQNLENLKIGHSEEDLRNIEQKVNQKFRFLRSKLSELIEEWSGNDDTELTDLLSVLSQAYFKNSGSDDVYVEVKDFRRDLVQLLVSNDIAVWDNEEERIKLFI